MNPKSKTAVSLYKQHRIVSQDLSEKYELDYPSSAWLLGATWPSKILSASQAYESHPQIKQALEENAQKTSKLYASAFLMNTEFLEKQVIEASNTGIVLVLPEAFSDSFEEILNQKPSLSIARAIDYCGYAVSYYWKVAHAGQLDTHDLVIDANAAPIFDSYDLDEAFSFKNYWTDTILVCNEKIGIGGFYYSSQDGLAMHVDSYYARNFRPWRDFTDEEINEAKERAEAVGSNAPWFEHVCIDQNFRRYRRIDVLK